MHRLRTIGALGVVALAGSLAPAHALWAAHASPLDRLPAKTQRDVSEARALVRTIRTAMAGDTITSRVEGLIEASGRAVPGIRAHDPSSADQAVASGLPVALRAPVEDIASAVQRATSLFRSIPAPILRWALRRMNHASIAPHTPKALPVLGGAFFVHRSKITRADPTVPSPVLSRPSVHAPRWVRTHRGLADRAALDLAASIDRALPALRAAAASLPAAPVTIDGCDVLDHTPQLCIGSTSNNVYSKDADLLIDLGGDDTYNNSAGAAYFATPDGQFGPPVGVNIDLGGNDTYDPKNVLVTAPTDTSFGSARLVADGAVNIDGVGMLIDASGNDRYTATAPPTDDRSPQSLSYVQGTAAAVLPGFAALLDLGGNDTYSVTGSSGSTDLEIRAQGFGSGLADGLGGLVDAGLGDDTYTIDAGTATGATLAPAPWSQHFAIGQGMSTLGTGVLVDGGGTDSFSLEAHGSWTTPDGYQVLTSVDDPIQQLPLAEVAGQGLGGIGNGFLLEGPGDTTYRADTTSEGIAYNSVSVQAIGSIGLGVLDDPSGNDTYSAQSSLAFDHAIRLDDTCTQPDPDTGDPLPCSSAQSFVDAYNTANFAQLEYAQGFGYLGGQGLLHDASGNDTYRSILSGSVHTSMHDAMTAPNAPARFDVWGYGVQWNVGQGVAQGEAANGILLDETGTDSYVSRSSTETVASAASDHGPGTPRVTTLEPYRDGVWAQGTGIGFALAGALLDLGGTGDHFEVTSSDSVSSEPDTGGSIRGSFGYPLAQAADQGGNATGVFVALGQGATVFVSPARGVCQGSPPRSSTAWVDCPASGDDPDHQAIDYRASTPALGLAPFVTGQEPTLTFTSQTPDHGDVGYRLAGDPPFADGNSIVVGATLKGPNGVPLPGRVVHFDLNGLYRSSAALDQPYLAWLTTWEADGVTDADGVAAVALPLEDMHLWGVHVFDRDWRLLATFDGGGGFFPVHAASPFTLTG